jgi:hypothetical protein
MLLNNNDGQIEKSSGYAFENVGDLPPPAMKTWRRTKANVPIPTQSQQFPAM